MNAREEITEMIAAVLAELEPCRHGDRNSTCHECAAVEVMELFPAVERNGRHFTLIRYGDEPGYGDERCTCSCHDCCVPLDASCEDCEEEHGVPSGSPSTESEKP